MGATRQSLNFVKSAHFVELKVCLKLRSLTLSDEGFRLNNSPHILNRLEISHFGYMRKYDVVKINTVDIS